MTLLKIAKLGHPVLRCPARPVDDPTAPQIAQLCDDMAATMLDAAGVGLAAPQVYRDLRVIVFRDLPDQPDDEAADGPSVAALINPWIEPVGEALALGLEGCLSIPGLRGLVPRYAHIRYGGIGPDGRAVAGEARDFRARVLQHEVDHLDGIVFLDRMPDHTLLSFEEEAHHLIDTARRVAEEAAAAEPDPQDRTDQP